MITENEHDDTLTIRIQVSEERLEGLSNRTLRNIRTDPAAMFEYIAHFMTDEDGAWLDREEALDILDELTFAEAKEAAAAVEEAMRQAAAPKASARKSIRGRGTR